MEDNGRDMTAVISRQDLDFILTTLRQLVRDVAEIKELHQVSIRAQSGYIRPLDFMAAVGIKRTKFNSLVATCRIKTIKKGRKVYIPVTEIDRYFTDPSIE